MISLRRLASVAGAVIQAIGRPDFEDGMRTGVQLEVSNGLQCVRTKPVVKLVEPLGRAKTMGQCPPWRAVEQAKVPVPSSRRIPEFVADQSPTSHVPHSSLKLVYLSRHAVVLGKGLAKTKGIGITHLFGAPEMQDCSTSFRIFNFLCQ